MLDANNTKAAPRGAAPGAAQGAPRSYSIQFFTHHPGALAQRDLVTRSRLDRRPIGSYRHRIVVKARELFDHVIAGSVPHVDPEGEMGRACEAAAAELGVRRLALLSWGA